MRSQASDPSEQEPSAAHPFETEERERYEDVAVLGIGGMGRVRLVLDKRLKRQVAYKEPHDSVDARRLSQEAWITAQLDHPGIVSVYDAGRDADGRLYYTMRLVRGRSLEDVLGESPGPAGLAQRLTSVRQFLAACEAVAFAHKAGIVHRDLKPHNIMVGEFGETIVVDWGVARPAGVDEPAWRRDVLPAGQAAETLYGEVVGTPAYMSPEQAGVPGLQDAPIDARSDVWSLGATLYRILAGSPPYAGVDTEEILRRLRDEPPPALEQRAPDAPRELLAIAHRALARAPNDRYPDARALAADVAAWLDGRRVSAHPYSPIELLGRLVRAWRVPLAVGLLALLALAVLAIASADRIVDERDRALAAESQTRAALRQSDLNLARSLLARAQSAGADGQRAESELLAAHALRLADGGEAEVAARARGIMMALDGPRPTLLEARLLPGCSQRRIDDTFERALCGGDTTSLYLLGADPPRLAWSRPVAARDVAFAAGHLVIATPDNHMIAFDRDGRETGRTKLRQPGRLRADGHALLAIYREVVEVVTLGEDGAFGAHEIVELCGGSVDMATVGHIAGELSIAANCDDRTLIVRPLASPERAARHDLPMQSRTLALSPDGTTLAMVFETGLLLVLAPADGRMTSLESGLVTALSLAWSPKGDQLVVFGEGEGARVFAWRDGMLSSDERALPSFDTLGVGWSSAGLWTLGASRALHWQFGAPPRPEVLGSRADPGIAGVAVSPGETHVAVARGEGRIDVWYGGAHVGARLGQRVVKRVAFSRDGRLLHVCGLDLDGVHSFDSTSLAPRGRLGEGLIRRIEVLFDDSILACGYGARCHRLERDGTVHVIAGALNASDLDIDRAGRRAIMLHDATGQVAVTGGDFALSVPLGHWLDARAVAIEGATAAVLTPAQVLLLDAADGAAEGEIAVADGLDVELFDEVVAVATRARTTRIHARDGRLIAVLGGHGERVSQVVLADQALFSASWDGTVRRYSLVPLHQPASALVSALESAWSMSLAGLIE